MPPTKRRKGIFDETFMVIGDETISTRIRASSKVFGVFAVTQIIRTIVQMAKPQQSAFAELYDIALQQQGFFTTKQAEAAGYRTRFYQTEPAENHSGI